MFCSSSRFSRSHTKWCQRRCLAIPPRQDARHSKVVVRENEGLAKFSTLKIGGVAKLVAEPTSTSQVLEAMLIAKDLGTVCVFIGQGSNVLFVDGYFDGMVIVNRLDTWRLDALYDRDCAQNASFSPNGIVKGLPARLKEFVQDNTSATFVLEAGAGCRINHLSAVLSQAGLGGLEFAVGIPGSVGGAAFMNAGAHGQDMSDVVSTTAYVDASKPSVIDVPGEDMGWEYRRSCFHDSPHQCIVSVTMRLALDPTAHERMWSFTVRRKQSQPVSLNSAGCVFRNPSEHISAGKVIESAGLKGFCIGGACVSDVHANYLSNSAEASAADFLGLSRHVKNTVAEASGIDLQSELRLISSTSTLT